MKRFIQMTMMLMVFSYFSGQAQSRKISISSNKLPLTRILEQIEKECTYSIVYSNEVIPDTVLVTVNVKRISVAELLDKILPEKQLFYKMMSERMLVIGSNRTVRLPVEEAENKITLSGRITDQKKNVLAFASVGLLQGLSYVGGSISNDNGVFQLSYPFKTQVKYTIKISSIGYQPLSVDFVYPDTVALKNLLLKEEQHTLNTVSITAARPLIERKTDRYIVNVEGSALADGNTGLEVLQKSPGIWVNSEGAIKIKGNQSVMVMINDVVQRMSEEDLAQYLRTLRSEDIKKIEIISNPPSEFEAAGAGGIVHIVLKKARMDGFAGQIGTAYKYGNRPFYAGGASADYKVKNLYAQGNVSLVKDKSNYIGGRADIVYPDQSTYAGRTDRYNDNSRDQYRFGLAYDLSKNQLIGLQVMGAGSEMLQTFKTSILLNKPAELISGNALSDWVRRPKNTGATLNYLLRLDSTGSTFKVIGDYVQSSKTELNDFTSQYTDPSRNSRYRNNTPNLTKIYSLQADYTKVLNSKLELKTGLKYVSAKRDNTILSEDFIADEWVKNTGTSNQFIYDEHLLMAYVTLEKNIHKTSIKLGLRAEETDMKGNSITSGQTFSRKYLGWFPTAFLVQKLNEKTGSAIYLNYSRRLRRPQFNYLNPYRLQLNDYEVMTGNPDLLPEYTHKIELGYNFWNGFSADVYYSRTENTIAQFVNPIADNVIEYQPRNFNNSSDYGITLDAPVKLFKWWTTNNSVVLFHLATEISNFKVDQYSVYAKSMHTITLKHLFDFDMFANYSSPYVTSNSKMGYIFYLDLGFTKKLLDNQLRMRLSLTDIFDTFKEQEYTNYKDTRISSYQKRPTRTIGLSLSYSFSSGKKFKNKKIEQSNEEEKNRIGN
ncbi:outer membrane receptor protein involved in Fe transport [Pedobacter sp. AK017]|uniref:outer membrane beta-barrel family protein n=1 Tax=Pedobacter sp. AK017 TaxID=2723073 RepID=UPI001611F3BE|nr:outer membrane beta-barrel family protein [Pedobacter sp. AK017]MBB5439573.1 outer membrane receptor protein involved in Fe transport [Pedobacter sp. AK017]